MCMFFVCVCVCIHVCMCAKAEEQTFHSLLRERFKNYSVVSKRCNWKENNIKKKNMPSNQHRYLHEHLECGSGVPCLFRLLSAFLKRGGGLGVEGVACTILLLWSVVHQPQSKAFRSWIQIISAKGREELVSYGLRNMKLLCNTFSDQESAICNYFFLVSFTCSQSGCISQSVVILPIKWMALATDFLPHPISATPLQHYWVANS